MPKPSRVDRLVELIDAALRATDREQLSAKVRDVFLPDVLDSLSATALVALIEEEWDLVIDDEDLVPEIFEDVSSLDAFIGRKLAAP